MAKQIQPVQVGSTDTLLVASRANELITSLNSLLNMQVQPAKLGTFKVGDGGNAILTIAEQGGGPATDVDFPFRLKLNGADSIRVVYGTLNDHVPQGMYPGDDPPFTLSVTGPGYVYLQFSYDDNTGEISNVVILSGSTVPASTETVLRKQIGSYSSNVDSVANSVSTSLWFERCGSYNLFGTA